MKKTSLNAAENYLRLQSKLVTFIRIPFDFRPTDEDRIEERLLTEVEHSRSCEVQPVSYL